MAQMILRGKSMDHFVEEEDLKFLTKSLGREM
jgi:hypothetical protein